MRRSRNRNRFKKGVASGLTAMMLAGCLTGCGTEEIQKEVSGAETVAQETGGLSDTAGSEQEWKELPLDMPDDKYRTFYEVFVYSFYDSNGDGIGDLAGLTQKLDYINDADNTTDDDLGCNGIWLMPIMPSATYHKYDVMDYCAIDSEYGTMEDFDALMEECKKRDIHVILDLVINHTSSSHPWFIAACDYLKSLEEGQMPDEEECPYIGYYNFSKEKQAGYCELDGTWYYEARFWKEMPDLNLGNERLREEISEIVDFWLAKGISGFRLDAAKEYYSGMPEKNIEVLSWFNSMVKEKKEDAYLVAEVWTDSSTYASYYSSGIDSVFDFDYADNSGIIANVLKGISPASAFGRAMQASEEKYAAYNENYVNAPFYTNHDLGRSAGYYAGDVSEKQTKMAGAMNLMMGGCSFVYYGEELGMKGAGKDENKRAPMYWSKDADAEGMCDGPADMDKIQMKYDSLEEQSADEASIYQYYKDAIRLRNTYPEIARGKTEYVESISDEQICAVKKLCPDSQVLLVMNLSEEVKLVDLSNETVNGRPAGEETFGGSLQTGEEMVSLKASVLTMPPFSIVLFR